VFKEFDATCNTAYGMEWTPSLLPRPWFLIVLWKWMKMRVNWKPCHNHHAFSYNICIIHRLNIQGGLSHTSLNHQHSRCTYLDKNLP
jgi:hypothetical protein